MKSKIFVIVAALLSLWPQAGAARVFNFSDQTLSTYLRGTFGLSNLQQYAYQPSFPPSVSFAGNVSESFSGEFGFGFTSSQSMTIRLGVEILNPLSPTNLPGNNASGTSLLSLTSQVYSVIPQANLEIYVRRWPESRMFLDFGAGYAITTIKNTVTMTAQGTSTLGLNNYIEEASGSGIMGQVGLGYEFAFFDNVGFSVDAGYRYLTVSNYTANRSFTSPAGSFTTGSPILNADGTARSTNLSGPFAGATFRFYFY